MFSAHASVAVKTARRAVAISLLSRCCRLVSDQFSIRIGSTRRDHRLPRL
jgi:hypothetical protein